MNHRSTYKIGLIDIIYGVLISYGFNLIDKASISAEYVSLSLAFAIIIADWLYFHRLYSKISYESVLLFLLDIAILFSVSQILSSAVKIHAQINSFWAWLSCCFLLYFLFDISLLKFKKPKDLFQNLKLCAIIDPVASLVFITLFFMLNKKCFSPILALVITVVTLVIAIYFWSRKSKPFEKTR